MNALDSPLDALAVNYLSFGFFTVVNNLWTWVAVITAAVSFWKMRASGPSILPPAEPCCDGISKGSVSVSDQVSSPASTTATERKGTVEQRKAVPEEAASLNFRFQVGGGDFDADTVTKGKFTLYYYEENTAATCSETIVTDKEEEEQLEQSAEGESEFTYRSDESSDWWERMMRLRRGDNSWYRMQDLTVFNGNVVRLWDWHVCSHGTSNMIRDNSCYAVSQDCL